MQMRPRLLLNEAGGDTTNGKSFEPHSENAGSSPVASMPSSLLFAFVASLRLVPPHTSRRVVWEFARQYPADHNCRPGRYHWVVVRH